MAALERAIYAIVAKVPFGQVATYGQIARLVGFPRHARHVGRALANAPRNLKLPWHRIVNSQGQISKRGMDGSDDFQRILLEEEGIEFGLNGRINLKRYLWDENANHY